MARFKLILLTVILVAGTTGMAYGIDETAAAQQYNEGIERYQARDFAGALTIFEELLASGIDHPDLYYNASNAAYRTGNLGKAILYIERALRRAPGDADARANLAFLNSMKADREPVEGNSLVRMLGSLYERFSVLHAAWLSAVSWILACLLGGVGLFLTQWKRITAFVITGCLAVVWIGSTGSFIQKTNHLASVQEAVIMQDEVSSYSGPGTDNTKIFTMHEGTTVTIERTEGSWVLIRLNSGAGGWILRDSIEVI